MGKIFETERLRILHLEDNPHDTEFVRAMLEREGLACTPFRVATAQEFESALEQADWQLIISDFSLPGFDGLKALTMANAKCPGVPFILFSGTIGEETAVQCLKKGAADYVLKQRPARLVPAIQHALKE